MKGRILAGMKGARHQRAMDAMKAAGRERGLREPLIRGGNLKCATVQGGALLKKNHLSRGGAKYNRDIEKEKRPPDSNTSQILPSKGKGKKSGVLGGRTLRDNVKLLKLQLVNGEKGAEHRHKQA